MTSIKRLHSVTIKDFRSIGGQITLPLDAPVVLIHGENGAGKTSVLSALELALSGSIESMRRGNAQYRNHLVHHGAEAASISVGVQLTDGTSKTWSVASSDAGWGNIGFLEALDADFYRERSYLAQSTLSRLLEIYEQSEASTGSALTKFVNDVLGLEPLEALIEGLLPAKDIRNARRLVPEIHDLENESRLLGSDSGANLARIRELELESRQLSSAIENQLDAETDLAAVISRNDLFTSDQAAREDENELVRLAAIRQEVEAMRQRLSVAGEVAQVNLDLLEKRADESERRADAWRSGEGAVIEALLAEINAEYVDIPSIAQVGPTEAVSATLGQVETGLQRLDLVLSRDDEVRQRLISLEEDIGIARARKSVLSEQIADLSSGIADVARIVGELIPHLQDECAVCGRDYSEISDVPLATHAMRRVATFSAQAARVAELGEARASAIFDLEQAEEELKACRARILSGSSRSITITKQARHHDWKTRLLGNRSSAARGTDLLRASSEARQSLAAGNEGNRTRADLDDLSAEIWESLPLHENTRPLALSDRLHELQGTIRVLTADLESAVEKRKRIRDLRDTYQRTGQSLSAAMRDQDKLARDLKELSRRINGVDTSREQAKRLLKAATETRSSIVRKVFNESLNTVWRDLFVRLAPSEPFVPAFHVSQDGGGTTPQLVTEHRGGGSGGSPGTMLSSGNLNTAALTLFLALHLSSGDRLPMLILDDPVQSMDDVHISQFAALLRTLSKQHGRQVVVAVHERALFDYLALELSPAFEGDRLLTVELTKLFNGQTAAEPQYYSWQADAVSAVG